MGEIKQMRLIKADEAKKAFIGNRYGTKAIEYVIDNVPTVEAIPVEWIEQYIWSADTHDEKRALRKMCIQWEKENEETE